MIDSATELTEEDIALTYANLDLLAEFVQEFINLPDEFDPPEHANVVFMPPDDRRERWLVDANLRIARRLAADGKSVMVWTIGSGKMTPLEDYEAALAVERISR
jgi:hypothetical protein